MSSEKRPRGRPRKIVELGKNVPVPPFFATPQQPQQLFTPQPFTQQLFPPQAQQTTLAKVEDVDSDDEEEEEEEEEEEGVIGELMDQVNLKIDGVDQKLQTRLDEMDHKFNQIMTVLHQLAISVNTNTSAINDVASTTTKHIEVQNMTPMKKESAKAKKVDGTPILSPINAPKPPVYVDSPIEAGLQIPKDVYDRFGTAELEFVGVLASKGKKRHVYRGSRGGLRFCDFEADGSPQLGKGYLSTPQKELFKLQNPDIDI
jgi:hypothetical protein